MLVGRADISRLARDAPRLERFAAESLLLPAVEILQVAYEAASADAEAFLPPALHPTVPLLVTWLAWRVSSGPLGEFTLAQTRLSCRSGVRPRAFLLSAAIEGPAGRLASEWGYRLFPAEVELSRGYDRIRARVRRGGRTLLEVELGDPEPLRPEDLQYTANMNLAATPRGLRLVQVDPDHAVRLAERGRPRLLAFDPEAWGEERVRPQDPVSASFAVADLTLPRIRYACRPDVGAFEGTEVVG